ncbi:MAG: tetrahydromethanopterin S-methyltransferase subunit H, partial [Candidatus Altiarchaeota archaeon]
AEEVGLVDRLSHNSINVGTPPEELEAIKESSLSSAILLAFNPLSSSLEGKIRVLEEGGGTLKKGLLEVAGDCGIVKPLVDTGITPLGEGASSAVRGLSLVKAKYGLPVGCGIHNAVLAWRWPDKKEKLYADAASNAMARMVGADFLLYGPIERASHVFSTVSLAECLLGEMSQEFGLDVSDEHPSGLLLK